MLIMFDLYDVWMSINIRTGECIMYIWCGCVLYWEEEPKADSLVFILFLMFSVNSVLCFWCLNVYKHKKWWMYMAQLCVEKLKADSLVFQCGLLCFGLIKFYVFDV